MICRKLSVVAMSGLTAALSLSAMAQDTTTSSSTTSTTMGTDSTGMSGSGSTSGSGSMAMSMEPTMVTGTVQRYYTDRSGFVTAMDVQTADGTRMVRFAPGMAQRLYSTYPVGGQISGTVQPSMSMGMSRYDMVAMGDQMPAAGMMKPSMVSDVETLRAAPFIVAGSSLVQFKGKLASVISDDMGEVLALVLSGVKMPGMMDSMSGGMMSGGMSAGGAMSTDTSSTSSSTMSTGGANTMDSGGMSGGMMGGGMMGGGMMDSMTLVRVPPELRQNSGAQFAGSERVSPLFKGADVEVVGYNEAPHYGVVSAYSQRVAANALVINGRAVGAVGLPRVMMGKKGSLFGGVMNTGGSKGGSMSAEEMGAMSQGYSTYGMSTGSDTSGGMSGSSDPSMTTGTTGATGGTTGGGS